MSQTLSIIYPSALQLDPEAPLGRPVSGVETAAVTLAAGLARTNHSVHFFGNVATSGAYRGFALHPAADFWGSGQWDVIIWIRTYNASERKRLQPDAFNILWVHDSIEDLQALRREAGADLDSEMGDLRYYLAEFNAVVFVSKWQMDQWETHFGPLPNARAIYNMCPDPDESQWASASPSGGARRVIHTSHPRKAMAAYWLCARAANQARRSHLFSCSSTPSLYQEDDRELAYPKASGGFATLGSFNSFRATAEADITFVYPYVPDGAAAFLRNYDTLLHPDYSGETGSIAVIEALKVGLDVIVSEKSVLPELVDGLGTVIPGHPMSHEFVAATIRALDQNPEPKNRTLVMDRFGESTLLQEWESILQSNESKSLAPGSRLIEESH
jgi:hypothetical protein